MYKWDWQVVWQFREAFFWGLLETCWLSLLAIVLGTVLGGLLVFARKSQNSILRFLSASYVVIFRTIPLLVLLLWIYYVTPLLLGVTLTPLSSAVLGLLLNGAAFYAENIRAGLDAVSKSQRESGLALGMNSWQTAWRVVIPQAVRNILPNLLNQYITTIKLTSLASVIGVAELVNRGGSIIASSFRPLEVYTALAALYLIIILPLDLFVQHFEHKFTGKGGRDVH